MKRFALSVGATALLSAMAVAAVSLTAVSQTRETPSQSEASEIRTFTLFVYEPPASFEQRADPARSPGYWNSFAEYGKQLSAAGVMRGGSAVYPIPQGKAVSSPKGETVVTSIQLERDGLALGGYFVIEVANVDAAVQWASKCPGAVTGTVIVRENVPMAAAMNGEAATPAVEMKGGSR